MKRLACALVLAACACAFTCVPRNALAARTRVSGGPQLSILTPDPAEIGDRVSLDVSFRGGAVDTVELYLDNALVAKRQLSTAQVRGVISFSLDAMILQEGNHDVAVKAYGPDGKVTAASAKLRIPAADLSAPVRIAYPQNGTQVSGIVPIRVALDQQIIRARPYVSFFVDKELMVLRNYPPYEYNWDTTRVINGWHVLEAWTQVEDAMGPTKARPIHVSVNNPTGETRRLTSIPDLRTAPAQPIIMAPADPRVSAPQSLVSRPVRPSAGDGRLSRPSDPAPGTASVGPVGAPTSLAGRPVNVSHPASRMAGGAISRPSGQMMVASAPRSTLPPLRSPEPLFAVVAPARTVAATLTMLVRPGDTLEAISKRTGVSAAELARLNNLAGGSKLRAGGSLIVPGTGSYDVAFDGQRILFDVLPREKNGVRLAPFRQIFEHTGGKMSWFGLAQTVRAVNTTREIEIKIGQNKARVNNEAVLMDYSPFIDGGRTIVPLSFVRDALGVVVNYDPRTGRMLLQSPK